MCVRVPQILYRYVSHHDPEHQHGHPQTQRNFNPLPWYQHGGPTGVPACVCGCVCCVCVYAGCCRDVVFVSEGEETISETKKNPNKSKYISIYRESESVQERETES